MPNILKILTLGLSISIVLSACQNNQHIQELEDPIQEDSIKFDLVLFNGEVFNLSDYKGQPAVINFWASWCSPCKIEMPVLEKAWKKYQPDKVKFLGVNMWSNETEATALAFLADTGVTFPTGPDIDNKVSGKLRISFLPSTLFLNRQHRVVRQWIGPIPEEDLEAIIETLL